jgi:hypothetical protein
VRNFMYIFNWDTLATASFIFRCVFVVSHSVFPLLNCHHGKLPLTKNDLRFVFLWSVFQFLGIYGEECLWLILLSYRLLLCKKPNKTLQSAAFMMGSFSREGMRQWNCPGSVCQLHTSEYPKLTGATKFWEISNLPPKWSEGTASFFFF